MAEQEIQVAPAVCGACPHLYEVEEQTPSFGFIILYRCGHEKGPIYVMPSELSEYCPLEKNETPKESDFLPSPGGRMHLSEEAIFLIEALRWYSAENCTESQQATIERHLSQIWTDGNYLSYLKAITSISEARIYSIIYQSIVGYQAVTQEASEQFVENTEDLIFEED